MIETNLKMEGKKDMEKPNSFDIINLSLEKVCQKKNNFKKNKSKNNFDFKLEKENKIIEKYKYITLEENEINEINIILKELNKAKDININKTILEKKENYEHEKECKEIISILKKPIFSKISNFHNSINTPFKPLLKPKKISLIGKVLYDFKKEDNQTKFSSKIDNN